MYINMTVEILCELMRNFSHFNYFESLAYLSVKMLILDDRFDDVK